nr:VanZ family protein [Streptomyces sp. HNM0574]
MAIVGWLTLRPLSVPWVAPANLEPLATISAELEHGPREAFAQLGDALLLLAPLGVLLPLATGRLHRSLTGTWLRTVMAGAMLSLVLALAQSGVPGHVVNIDKVLLNATGVALSCLFLFPPVRAVLRRRHPAALRLPGQPPAGSGATPRRARVGIAP